MKTQSKTLLIGIAVVLLSVFITSGLIISKPVPKTNNEQHNALYVKTQTVNNKPQKAFVKYHGRVLSFDKISLSSEVSGKILAGEVLLKEGQCFEKGDVLVRIYSEDYRASMKSAKSSFLRSLSSVLPDISVDFPEEFEKWKSFFAAIDIDGKLPELPAVNSEQEKIFLASRGLMTEYYSLQQQEIQLKKYTLYAPFNGCFKSVYSETGSITNMGGQIASLIRTDKLEIVVPVKSNDIQYIKIGDEVELYSNNGRKEFGTVNRIANFIDPGTQSVNVYVDYYPNEKKSFKEGEYLEVAFTDNTPILGLLIPREALMADNKVYTLDNNSLKTKKVSVERELDDYVIISGLEDGSVIVTESMIDTYDGMKVKSRS